MAADMVIQAMGLNFASAGAQPANVFGAVMIVMSIGIMFGIITNIIAAKKFTTSMADYNRKSGGWGAVFSGCFMMAMMSVMMPLQVYNPATGWNFVGTLTLLTSAGIGLLIATIAKKTGAKWLNDFNLAIVLILGMASSVLWTNVVGMFA